MTGYRQKILILALLACIATGYGLVSWGVGGKPSSKGLRPNVLLISLDTLRADHLGSYGYQRPQISPFLDQLAREGVRFEYAISHAPWTTPSHMSMLTSMVPSSHLVNQGWADFERYLLGGGGYRVLPDSVVTLAEALQQEGYSTMALTGGGTVAGSLGFAQGFDSWAEGEPDLLDDWDLIHSALDQAESQPFFFFLHSFEIHAPYSRTMYAEPFLRKQTLLELKKLFIVGRDVIYRMPALLEEHGRLNAEVMTALYDGGVRHADSRLGLLFEELRRRDLYDNTIIIVTSDHGEEFGDHSDERIYDAHCTTVYDELLRVPLIVRLPGNREAGREVAQQVELIDLPPTILELAGAPAPSAMQGRSLVPFLHGKRLDGDSLALSESTCAGPELKSLRTDQYKYIASFDRDAEGWTEPLAEELFDLSKDPKEQHSLHESEGRTLERMRGELKAQLHTAGELAVGRSPRLEVDQKRLDKLRSLGYVQ